MKLIIITKPNFFIEEDQIITALFEEGLDMLHLRKPNAPQVYTERLLTLIPEQYHKKIITHERFHLKSEFKLAGIHLNARHPYKPENYTGHISMSCHSIEEVKQQKGFHDYLFLSPIFDSISKENYHSAFMPQELRQAAKNGIIDKRVMALGGICLDNILQVKDYGFGGAVILGDLWNRFDDCCDRDYQEIIKHFNKLKCLAD